MDTKQKHKIYYYLNRLMSNTWAWFYIAIGSRGRGKTTSAWRWVLKRYIKYGEKFIWLRLSESPIKKMNGARGTTLVQRVVLDELDLESVVLRGTIIYVRRKGSNKLEEAGLMDALSTFYTTKGSDLSAYTNVVLDEFNREAGEKNSFDVVRSFINEIETIARTRTNVRVLMLANVIDEVSDILSIFNFQPQHYGLFKLRSKRCVIEYLEDSPEWIEYSKHTLSRTLLGNVGETADSFVNRKEINYNNIVRFNNRFVPSLILYVTNTLRYEVYNMGDMFSGGLFIDNKIRNEDVVKLKLTPFLTADAIYDQQSILELRNLLGSNAVYYPSIMVRSSFLVDFKGIK